MSALILQDDLARALAVGADARSLKSLAIGGQTVVVVGDSITEQMGYTDDATRQFDISYAVAANAQMGGRFRFLNNGGVGGIKSDEMLANMSGKVIRYAPDWCWMLIGANDINSVSTDTVVYATFKASVLAAIDLCRAAGIRVLIGTILPTGSSHSTWSTSRVRRMHTLNNWIKMLPFLRPGVVVADYAAAVIDPASTSAQPKSGYLQSDDYIHPTHKGAWYMGAVVASALTGITPAFNRLPISPTDRYSYDTGGDQIMGDPFFLTGTGGTNSTSGTITGNVPSGMTLAKGGTWGTSYGSSDTVARADGFGNDWRVTVTNTGANDDNLLFSPGNLVSRVSAGDKMFAVCHVSMSGLTNWKGAGLRLESSGTPGTVYGSGMERASTDNTGAVAGDFLQADHDYVISTAILTVPAGVTSLYCYLRARWVASGGAGVFRVGRWGFYKVPSLF